MSKAFIIAVGNELLSGQRVDTNSSWLQGRLLRLGIETVGGYVVPDENDRIVAALKEASASADIVVITGGLGPTDDDLTRGAMADFLGKPLEIRKNLLCEIEDYFQRRGRPMASTNRIQAYLPAGAEPLGNSRGTAPGIFAQQGGKMYFCLPGVPYEMETMFDDFAGPKLAGKSGGRVVLSGKVRTFGMGESTIAEKLGDRMARGRNPLINCTAHMGDIVLHIIADACDTATAETMIEQDRKQICDLLAEAVYGFDEQPLPDVVAGLLKRKNLKLALAESCTGGLTAKMITDVPGSSEVFLGGWVTYSNEAKVRDLGLSPEGIENDGAVSESVARAMAEGAAARSGADVAVSITGIAGPEGGTPDKPVGLVYIGLFFEGKTEVRPCRFSPVGRTAVRHRTALTALNWLRLKMIEGNE